MKTLSLKLPEALYGDLVSLAEHKGMSRSAIVREALIALFGKERAPVRGSTLALVEDLVGSVEGPEDLSVNQAYLDDLGR